MIDQAFIKRIEEEIGTPVSRALALTIRPSFIAPEGQTLVWGDWSAIEARVLPWLADTRASRKVLDVFEGNDNDRTKPDIYMMEVANLKGMDAQELWDDYLDKNKAAKNARQEGKVSVLSLGFGGSIGALMNMANNYGVFYSEADAKYVVDAWRANNPWARSYWDKLWEAVLLSMDDPGTIYKAGRVAYLYDENYMGGTVFCGLPDSRLITYPRIKWRKVEVENPVTGAKEEKKQLSYLRGYGYAGLWYGKLAENITQATAASLLRRKLVELRPERTVTGHTHDEIISLVDEERADAYADHLGTVMKTNPEWMPGCPLAVETTKHWYYTKAVD